MDFSGKAYHQQRTAFDEQRKSDCATLQGDANDFGSPASLKQCTPVSQVDQFKQMRDAHVNEAARLGDLIKLIESSPSVQEYLTKTQGRY